MNFSRSGLLTSNRPVLPHTETTRPANELVASVLEESVFPKNLSVEEHLFLTSLSEALGSSQKKVKAENLTLQWFFLHKAGWPIDQIKLFSEIIYHVLESPIQRQIFWLRHFEEMALKDISVSLGCDSRVVEAEWYKIKSLIKDSYVVNDKGIHLKATIPSLPSIQPKGVETPSETVCNLTAEPNPFDKLTPVYHKVAEDINNIRNVYLPDVIRTLLLILKESLPSPVSEFDIPMRKLCRRALEECLSPDAPSVSDWLLIRTMNYSRDHHIFVRVSGNSRCHSKWRLSKFGQRLYELV